MSFSEASRLSISSFYDSVVRKTSTPLCSSFNNDSGYHSHNAYTPFVKPNLRPSFVTPVDSPLPPSSFTSNNLSDSVVQVLFEDEDLKNSVSCLDDVTPQSIDYSTPEHSADLQHKYQMPPSVKTNLPKTVINICKDQQSQKRKNILGPWTPGQEIGEQHIDFIRELSHYRNCTDIALEICSYLSPQDLINVGQVSHSWRKLVENIPELKCKRNGSMLPSRFYGPGFGKENHNVCGKPRLKGPRLFGMPLTGLANQVQCTPLSPVQKDTPCNTSSRLPQFQEQAKKLLPCEHLQPCPRCQFPSRVTPREKRAHCTSTNCSFDYCTQCKGDFHAPTPCKRSLFAGTIIRSPHKRDLIGHKGARRNLKRL